MASSWYTQHQYIQLDDAVLLAKLEEGFERHIKSSLRVLM